MKKILVEVSVGELLDKISILEIKKERITDVESAKFIQNEYAILKDQLDKNILDDAQFSKNQVQDGRAEIINVRGDDNWLERQFKW